jgi:solute carrier family 10 (sodium/bile acid cotransporter), member 7
MSLCCLPSTVQSSIAFTSIARGNVGAAICSASLSNLIGIVLTPLLVTLLLFTGTHAGALSLGSVREIMSQLLVPFVAGQLLRRWIGGFVTKHK